jgi:hypothetical protein
MTTVPAPNQYVGGVCPGCGRCRVCGQPAQPITTQPSWVVTYPSTISGIGTWTCTNPPEFTSGCVQVAFSREST